LRQIDPRHSSGEEELARFAEQPLLRGAEPAFAPERAGLGWRFGTLVN
jgi:hypothetical protein